MDKKIKAVVLAAGKSKRMNSKHSKVVHKILGKEIVNYLIDALSDSGIDDENIIVVVGENSAEVKKVIRRKVKFALQMKQLGTADALISATPFLKGFDGDILVTVGDNPYITSKEFNELIAAHRKNNNKCTLLSALFPDIPPPYGRIVRGEGREIDAIVEEVDATDDQLKIREVNASIYMFDYLTVFPNLKEIRSENKKKEFYLTDIVSILKGKGIISEAVVTDNYLTAVGINNRSELAEAQKVFNEENIKNLELEHGVTVLQPESVTIEKGVRIGKDTVIYPSTYIGSGTSIGKNCKIGPFVHLKNTVIGDGKEISFKEITG